jgi:hypothetical protein
MDPGFILDKAHYNNPVKPEWVEGKPEYSFWTGMKIKDRERHFIVTYRCERCGFLESYAGPA